MAERVRSANPTQQIRFLELPAGRLIAGITAAGLLDTTTEAGLLHFRGAHHSPFMFLPVTIYPAAAAILISEMALGPRFRNRPFSRWRLRLTAAIGLRVWVSIPGDDWRFGASWPVA
jgi:hypothetical protein